MVLLRKVVKSSFINNQAPNSMKLHHRQQATGYGRERER